MYDDSRPKMRTIPQASQELNISAYTLRRLCKEGTIPHIRSGNRILLNVQLLADILNDNNIPLAEPSVTTRDNLAKISIRR